MAYKVLIEGQEIPVPDEIGADDAKVKQALAPFFPDAANAMLTRTEKDGDTLIAVTKRAGTKGALDLGVLQESAGGMNPAVALYREFMAGGSVDLEPEQLTTLSSRIDAAIREGEEQAEAMGQALKRLQAARPAAAPAVVVGF